MRLVFAQAPLLLSELAALEKVMANPAKPLVAIVGGSKVSTKLTALQSLLSVVDQLIVGGGIANTFIMAAGHDIGKSLCEPDLVSTCQRLMLDAKAKGVDILVPIDVVCGQTLSAEAKATTKAVTDIKDDDMIFDIGSQSAQQLVDTICRAGTVIWNGPVGAFEFSQFGQGTEAVAKAVAASDAFSVAGGGDTLAAASKYGVSSDMSYISTGGGAFLEFLEGKTLPAMVALSERAMAFKKEKHINLRLLIRGRGLCL